MDVSWIPNGEDAEFDGNEIVCKLLDDIDKVNENLADPLKSVE